MYVHLFKFISYQLCISKRTLIVIAVVSFLLEIRNSCFNYNNVSFIIVVYYCFTFVIGSPVKASPTNKSNDAKKQKESNESKKYLKQTISRFSLKQFIFFFLSFLLSNFSPNFQFSLNNLWFIYSLLFYSTSCFCANNTN